MSKRAIAAIATVGVIGLALIAGLVYWQTRGPRSGPGASRAGQARPPSSRAKNHGAGATSAPAPKGKPESQPRKPSSNRPSAKTATPAKAYCEAGHDKRDTKTLTQAGGLVRIFQQESVLPDAYGCAEAYLGHGGPIDAADPRAESKHLTPLLFAIKRNDPKMVRFMIDHGADLSRRGGPKNIKPYGYAVFSALQHRNTNYNKVIGILDSSLKDNAAAADDKP